jgi:hypothetical protein
MPAAPAAFTEIPAEHAIRHQLRPDGRESLAQMFVFPEDGIAGFVYPSVCADGQAKGRGSLFGPALPELLYEQAEETTPEAMNFDDWRTGPLRMRVVEPHRKVDIAWDGTQITFDGHFEAMYPAYGRRHLCGYLYRDGTMGHVAEVDYEISCDEQMTHDRIRASVVDDRGRAAIVDSTTFASEQVDADPMVYLNEAALTVQVDGQPGTGWCEFCWNRNYVDFARGYLAMYG